MSSTKLIVDPTTEFILIKDVFVIIALLCDVTTFRLLSMLSRQTRDWLLRDRNILDKAMTKFAKYTDSRTDDGRIMYGYCLPNGMKHGIWTTNMIEGQIIEENWFAGKKHGVETLQGKYEGYQLISKWSDGMLISSMAHCPNNYTEIYYLDGKKSGYELTRIDHTLINSKYYVAGLAEGCEKGWYTSGQIRRQTYWEHGVRHGEETQWWENGNIKNRQNWKNGERCGSQSIYTESGVLVYHCIWDNNKRNGSETMWWADDGKIAVITQWIDDRRGTIQFYLKNGGFCSAEEPYYRLREKYIELEYSESPIYWIHLNRF
jgi:antitoxin component YwqK of YwqJK toxin-antitoxin module